MDRKKYYNRDWRTTEEKEDIARKSDNRCCHCGQLKYVHYGATIDHFIPLDKGGCDRNVNLIMLCEQCNEEKDNKVVDISYVPYLKDKYKKELADYLDNYIQTIEYIERNRLFALDEYPIHVESFVTNDFGKHHNKQKTLITKKYIMKRATFNDLDRLCDYYIKYLKKIDCLDDEFSARENLIFWLTFGCIYYFEKNNEIILITIFTIKHVSEGECYKTILNIPKMYIFSYYTSDMAITLVKGLIYNLPEQILKEQNIKFLPYVLSMIKKDKMITYVYNYLTRITGNPNIFTNGEISGFMDAYVYVGTDFDTTYKINNELTESDKNLKVFSSKFDNVTEQLVKFFTKYSDRVYIGWMIYDLMSYEYIKDTELYNILFDENGHLKTT